METPNSKPRTPSLVFNAVIGTAGHIDHGKSALVQALTGIHPDRLKEEQERGITIDLGFAPLELKNGLRAGIIDVPGHERFIKNMAAGASSIDFVLLAIAADDGVMAQTREHLQIIQLLGVRHGLTVITKRDLVEPDYLELVAGDVQALLAGTFLEGAPILPVSSKTGAGLPELREALEAALSKIPRRTNTGPLRMPIQRVFVKEGFGTVLTGVPLSGHVAVGDTLEVLPPGYTGRVKGLHAYRHAITQGQAGHSTAINLHGPQTGKQEIVRGMVAATPGVFRPTTLFAAHLKHLPGAPWPLKHRAPVRFHAGTAEIQGKVLLLEGDCLPAGQSGWIQISLDEPAILVPGDRFILRHQTPMVTLGGGRVVDVRPVKRKRNQPEVIRELEARLERADDAAEFLALLLETSASPRPLPDLCAETGLLPGQASALLGALAAQKRAVALKNGAVYAAAAPLDALFKTLRAAVSDYLKEHPALGGIERPELRRRFALAAGPEAAGHFDDVLQLLSQRGGLQVESNLAALPGRARTLDGPLALQAQQAEAAFKAGGLAPPAPADVEASLKVPPKVFKEICRYLLDTGRLAEAAPGLFFHTEPYEQAASTVRQFLQQKGEATTSEIRQVLNMNRKYVVPLAELFDRRKLTVRTGSTRRLA